MGCCLGRPEKPLAAIPDTAPAMRGARMQETLGRRAGSIVASTSSLSLSASSTTAPTRSTAAARTPAAVIKVSLERPSASTPFGLVFIGAANTDEAALRGPGIFLSAIRPGSPAANSPRLRLGQQVLSINGTDTSRVTVPQMAKIVSCAGTIIEMELQRNIEAYQVYKNKKERSLQASATTTQSALSDLHAERLESRRNTLMFDEPRPSLDTRRNTVFEPPSPRTPTASAGDHGTAAVIPASPAPDNVSTAVVKLQETNLGKAADADDVVLEQDMLKGLTEAVKLADSQLQPVAVTASPLPASSEEYEQELLEDLEEAHRLAAAEIATMPPTFAMASIAAGDEEDDDDDVSLRADLEEARRLAEQEIASIPKTFALAASAPGVDEEDDAAFEADIEEARRLAEQEVRATAATAAAAVEGKRTIKSTLAATATDTAFTTTTGPTRVVEQSRTSAAMEHEGIDDDTEA
eukprot:m.169262 g.169262  ORF g.169262 m.169262 type:complete len:466 (+) comp10363_c0_seq4:169-1566(+)